MNEIFLSIIIPIYNGERYIDKCFSKLPFENEEIEIIAIDDGSTDNTAEILNNIKEEKQNLNVYIQKNKGVSEARNLGINKSRGKWIMFIDIDDEIEDTSFDNAYKMLKKDDKENSKLDMVICSKNYDREKFTKDKLIEACLLSNNKLDLNKLRVNYPISKFYNRLNLINNKIEFNSKIINGEDMIFNLKNIKNAKKIAILSIGFYLCKKNLQSSTNTYNNKVISSDIEFNNEIRKILNENKWKETIDIVTVNGIYKCFLNETLNSKSNYSNLNKLLDMKNYKEAINNLEELKVEIDRKKYIILKLIKNNKIKQAKKMMKIYIKIKKVYYKFKKDNVVIEKI